MSWIPYRGKNLSLPIWSVSLGSLLLLFLFGHQVILTSCDPVDCSMPGSSVLHYFSEFTQSQVFWVSDAYLLILCLPLLHLPSIFPSIRVFCFCFCLFPQKWVLCISWPKYWPMHIQGSFPLGLTNLILQSKGFSTVFSSSTVQKYQPSLWTNPLIPIWLLVKT